MGNGNDKQNVLSEWSSVLGPFINNYLEKKHKTVDNYYDNTRENYRILKENEALKYINNLDIKLQEGLILLSEMAPNLSCDIITFKEEHQLKMLELMYIKQFISLLENVNKYSLLNLDNTMTVNYDSQVCEDSNGETNIIRNIQIVIVINGYNKLGTLGYELNNV